MGLMAVMTVVNKKCWLTKGLMFFPGVKVIKLLSPSSLQRTNRLERLSIRFTFIFVGKAKSLPLNRTVLHQNLLTNIRLGWKFLQEANALAYLYEGEWQWSKFYDHRTQMTCHIENMIKNQVCSTLKSDLSTRTRGMYYKTFYGRKLRIFVIS